MIIILRLRHPVTVTFSTFPCCILLGFVLYKDMHFHHVTMGFLPGVLQNWPKGGEKVCRATALAFEENFHGMTWGFLGKPRLSKWCLTQVFSRFACFWKHAKNKKFEHQHVKKTAFEKKPKKTWLTMSSCNGHFFTRQTIRHLVTWGCKCPSVHNIFCRRSQFKGLASGFSWDFQRITAFLKRKEHTKKTRFRPGAALQASWAHQISQFKLETLSRYSPCCI